MGDYTRVKVNGQFEDVKIGTCGSAYYATKQQLEDHQKKYGKDTEVSYYLDPANGCNFAFPFPAYDGKEVGQISNFHGDQRTNFYFSWKVPEGEVSHHKDIVQHLHPDGSDQGGINLWSPCPSTGKAKTSNNFDVTKERYRLETQVFYGGALAISARCVYCGCSNVFTIDEAILIVKDILDEAKRLIEKTKFVYSERSFTTKEQDIKEIEFLQQIAKRIMDTYEPIEAN